MDRGAIMSKDITKEEIVEKIKVLSNKIHEFENTKVLKELLPDKLGKFKKEKKDFEVALEFLDTLDQMKDVNDKTKSSLQSIDERMAALDKKYSDSKNKFNVDILKAVGRIHDRKK